jgi:AraC-like DNA-binding protein
LIGPALELMHAEPGKPWTVSSLAKHLQISRSAFAERFHRLVGQTPLRYLTERRMVLASDLLRDTEMSVKQIAAQVGYETPASFSNVFKRWFDQSPAQYRKSIKADSTRNLNDCYPVELQGE